MWTHKVVKSMRGMQGQWFDFPTAATFAVVDDACVYAQDFAREQGAAGVLGARIEVRSRRGPHGGDVVSVYRSDDYLEYVYRDQESCDEDPDGSRALAIVTKSEYAREVREDGKAAGPTTR